jgi:hypothetical protein
VSGISTFFVNSISVAILSYFHGTTTKNEIGKTEISLAIWDEITEIKRTNPTIAGQFRSVERIIFTTREPSNRDDVERTGFSLGSSKASSRVGGGDSACITGGNTEAESSATPAPNENV